MNLSMTLDMRHVAVAEDEDVFEHNYKCELRETGGVLMGFNPSTQKWISVWLDDVDHLGWHVQWMSRSDILALSNVDDDTREEVSRIKRLA